MQHLDIYKISCQDVDVYLRIPRFDLGNMDIYMPSIIPQLLATDPSHGRAKIAAICVKVFTIV